MKYGYIFRMAAATATLALVMSTTPAEVINLNPVKDATLVESVTGILANGASDAIYAGRTQQGVGLELRRALVQFDVSSINPAATINSVTLSLFLVKNNIGSTLNLHKVTSSWTEGPTLGTGSEGGAGGTAVTGDVTWVHRTFNTQNWTTAGGDFIGVASATQTVTSAGSSYNWTSAQMVADVQDWISNPGNNFGWILIGNEALAQSAQKFYSREGATQPVLTIDVTPPTSVDSWTIY